MVTTLETGREQFMSWRTGDYDPDLQMVVERSRDADLARLEFLRWLVERNRQEHPSEKSLDLPVSESARPVLAGELGALELIGAA